MDDPKPKDDAVTLDIVSNLIRSKFEPIESEADADLVISTQEISNKIHDHTGIDLDTYVLYDLLHTMGFIQASDDELNFHWILKLK